MEQKQGDAGGIDEQARAFWAWFETVESQLRSLEPGSAVWKGLDERIEALGVEAWEIGPALLSTARYSFTLSPSCDADLYRRTQRIVELAPALPDWEFLPAVPRKQWERAFLWSEAQIPIDASAWRVVVYRYEDGQHELVLLGDVLSEFDHDGQLLILQFVILSELGEAAYIERVQAVDIERAPSQPHIDNSIPITALFQAVVAGRSAH